MNKIIAIVGMCGSGKSIACEYFESIGYKKIYFGGVTYKLMKEQGIIRDEAGKNEKAFREKLRIEYGPECYAKLLEADIQKALSESNVVLDGLYSWHEYKFLIEKFPNLKLVCIIDDKNIRYERVAIRPERPFDHESIVYRDLSEIENIYKGGPIAYADFYILNNGTMEDYHKDLVELNRKLESYE